MTCNAFSNLIQKPFSDNQISLTFSSTYVSTLTDEVNELLVKVDTGNRLKSNQLSIGQRYDIQNLSV